MITHVENSPLRTTPRTVGQLTVPAVHDDKPGFPKPEGRAVAAAVILGAAFTLVTLAIFIWRAL
jgi:hypothetical protein